MLKIAANIFDPMGTLSVFTINRKVLFQEFCVNKVGWDEELQGDFRNGYQQLISGVEGVLRYQYPTMCVC